MGPRRHKSLSNNNLQSFCGYKKPPPEGGGATITNNKPKLRLTHPQPLPCQGHSQHDCRYQNQHNHQG